MRQIEIVRRRPCDHPRASREPIATEGGRKIAERCASCQRIVQIRMCAGCARRFRLTERSARHGKIYHSVACRRAAARRRRVERERSGQLDPRDT